MNNNPPANYEHIATRLLEIAPILATVNMLTNTPLKPTEVYNHLFELNELCNGSIKLVENELKHGCFNVRMPAPSSLPKKLSLEDITTHRDRLITVTEEFIALYLMLVHARKSYEENWGIKYIVTMH